jgi:Ca-activated chloride channel family protein
LAVLMRVLGPVLIGALLLPQQQQPPVFRSGVSTVAVYATVTDFAGQLVRDLTRNDFEVLDNGRVQDLTVFSTTLQPITAVLLVDTSASMALTLDLARQAAEQFIIRMMPGDQARVGNFSDTINLGRPFTGDRDLLLKAFESELHIGNPTRLWDAIGDTMSAIADVGGRRVVVLFTDGQDTASVTTGRQILERAKAEDIMVYGVQIRSRVRPDLEWDILGARTNQQARNRRGDPSPTQILRGIAGQTGGLHFTLNQNDDVNATFTQVATELHQQYLLGFTPKTSDGRVHELQVRVKSPRFQVRARRYYLAPKEAR